MEGLFTQNGLIEIKQLIANYLQGVKIVVDGTEYEKAIYKKVVTDDRLEIYIKLDDTVVGHIESINILSTKGTVILKKTEDIYKNTDKGLLISIPIKIIEDYQGSELR